MKKYFANALLLFLSVSISLLLAEGVIRLFFSPLDYLMPEVKMHEALGHIIAENSAGHDAWGFRNKSVPEQSDIVAIGDSQTYGDSAIASGSWPAQLQKQVNRPVYNLALGGYGPGQYLYLLEHMAVKLKPRQVIVGFYYGNDLIDSYNYANKIGNDFSSFKKQKAEHPIRFWLSRHSVLYRMITYSGIGDLVRKRESKKTQPDTVLLAYSSPPIYTVFTPEKRLSALNLEDEKVRQGLALSMAVFKAMKEFCLANKIELTFLLIPTKERVYYDRLTKDNVNPSYQLLIKDENSIDSTLKAMLTENQIAYVDAFPVLASSANTQQIYPMNDDGHPNQNGYQLIAKALSEKIQ